MSNPFIFPILSTLFSLFFLIMALLLPKTPQGIGPGGWPSVILGLMLILSLLLLIKTYRSHQQVGADQEVKEEQGEHVTSRSYRHWLVLGISVLYFFLMPYIGFVVATPLYLIAVARLLGMTGWLKIICLSIICSAFFIYLFAITLMLPLPRGLGLFRTLSLLLY